MHSQSDLTKILLDADVIRHFLFYGNPLLLSKIYPKRLVILDLVKKELCRSKHLQQRVNNFIHHSGVEEMAFPNQKEIVKEFASLIRELKGEGESACMAVAKYQRQYIASSNLKDIKTYCEAHQIVYLTTMNILADAIAMGVMTEGDCDQFIGIVKSNNQKLPYNSMQEYYQKDEKGKSQKLKINKPAESSAKPPRSAGERS